MLVCFAVFIVAWRDHALDGDLDHLACQYWLSGTIKRLLLASVPTAILLVKLVPMPARTQPLNLTESQS